MTIFSALKKLLKISFYFLPAKNVYLGVTGLIEKRRYNEIMLRMQIFPAANSNFLLKKIMLI